VQPDKPLAENDGVKNAPFPLRFSQDEKWDKRLIFLTPKGSAPFFSLPLFLI
jgi:hypothetical protein